MRDRLHPARQRTLDKTAINKDEVRIRTADSFNQIRNIKVLSKAKETDERTRRWTEAPARGSCGGRHSSRGGREELASIFGTRTSEDKEPPPSPSPPSNPRVSSSSSSARTPRDSSCFLTPARLGNHGAWPSNRVPIIKPLEC